MSYASRNKNVFNFFLKIPTLGDSWTSTGKALNIRGAEYSKLLFAETHWDTLGSWSFLLHEFLIWQFAESRRTTRSSEMYLGSAFLRALKANRQILYLILALTGRKCRSIHSGVTRSREKCETPLTTRAAEFTRIWRGRRSLLGS